MRIQRKRTRGWKMPANCRYVGRPSRWGNPYSMKEYGRAKALELYSKWLDAQLKRDPAFLDALRGKDLVCWCRLDDPCHADLLIAKLGTA